MALMAESAPQFAYQAVAYFPVPFHLQNACLTVPQVTTTSVPAAASSSVAPIIGPVYPTACSLPQYQQAQQSFQKDALIVTREALTTVKAAVASSTIEQKLETKKRKQYLEKQLGSPGRTQHWQNGLRV